MRTDGTFRAETVRAGARALVLLVLAAAATSCDEYRSEVSPELREDVAVIARIHTPSRHQTNASPTMVKVGGGVGIGADGNLGLSFGGITISESDVPETFGVALRCPHGEFVSQDKGLYDALREGQKGVAVYREVYRLTYRDQDREGPVLVARTLVRRELLNVEVDGRRILPRDRHQDATPRPAPPEERS